MADIIAYGGGFHAVAAAAKAENNALSKSMIVIGNTTYLNYVGLPQSKNKIIGVCTYVLTFFGIALNYVANLLLPDYAAGVSSFAWCEIRAFPNLCVWAMLPA